MIAFITLLFVSTLAALPGAHLESANNDGISYRCYIGNDNVILTKIGDEQLAVQTEIIEIGISTNSLENISITFTNDDVRIMALYSNNDSFHAYFDKNSL